MSTRTVLLKALLSQVGSLLALMGVGLTFNQALLACTEPSSTQSSPISNATVESPPSNSLPPMSSEESPSLPVSLKNSSWRLETWQRKGSTVRLVSGADVSLDFKDNQVNGFGGCNRFSGSFNVVDDQLFLGVLDSTQRGCDPIVMNQESQFLSALQSVRRIAIDPLGRLALFYGLNGEEGVLYFSSR